MNTRFTLTRAETPTHWYNILADIPEPLPPPLHPGTRKPVSLQDMTAIFPENLVAQKMTTERSGEIPAAVREIYALWRPTPLFRAVRLEKEPQTPAHLLQVRRRKPRGKSQTEYGCRPSLLQQGCWHQTARHGNVFGLRELMRTSCSPRNQALRISSPG